MGRPFACCGGRLPESVNTTARPKRVVGQLDVPYHGRSCPAVSTTRRSLSLEAWPATREQTLNAGGNQRTTSRQASRSREFGRIIADTILLERAEAQVASRP